MNFISTRGGEKVTGAQAIVKGLADNGGLYVPEKFPKVTKEELERMAETKTTRLAGGSLEAFAVEQSRRSGRLPCVRGAVGEAD